MIPVHSANGGGRATYWTAPHANGVASFHFPVVRILEASDMSPKQQRKFRGFRRNFRRPRDWTRWFREGVLDAEPRGSVRLRTTLSGARLS